MSGMRPHSAAHELSSRESNVPISGSSSKGFAIEKYFNKNFWVSSRSHCMQSLFMKLTQIPPAVTIASGEILFFFVSALFRPGAKRGIVC